MTSFTYQVGGSLQLCSPTYIERQADREILSALSRGELCYISNARQMGKSSLRIKIQQQLNQLGGYCIHLDLTLLGDQQITLEQWYCSLMLEVLKQLQISERLSLRTWITEHSDLSPLQQFAQLIETILLVEIPNHSLFILVDELDHALNLKFSIADFLGFIQSCYDRRTINPLFDRLNWVTFGTITPAELLRDRPQIRFNLGTQILLHGFQRSEVLTLTPGLPRSVMNPQAILEAILDWTGGQPFLTQKLCNLVIQFADERTERALSGNERFWIYQLVRSHIIQDWERQDEPEHLRTIRNYLLWTVDRARRLLSVYQQLLQGERIVAENCQTHHELLQCGLVIVQQGQLQIHNSIYRTVFNLEWIANQLNPCWTSAIANAI